MFTTLIVQPIFNILVLIYAIIPGHNFGISIILFTILIRLLLWPLVKKQLHQAKVMRKVQPEIKKIKAASKGDKQKESQMLMELYKEKGINPLGSIGILLIQLPIFLALYSGIKKIIDDPHQIITFAYPPLQHLPWMKELAANIHLFDATLFGIVDLTKSALGSGKAIYWPAMVIVLASAIVQFYQSKQLMPTDKNARKLRQILKDASSGNAADTSEVNAAVGKSTRYLLPVMIFLFTVSVASALSLYWLTSGIVAFIQQHIVLSRDEEEMEEIADKPEKVIEGEVISKTTTKKPTKKTKAAKTKKRRK
ncbi:MAG: YidC/Oxa1 family membrane protein insertase [bacterium]|jgi:YidC/Oxa1 family membrane protein insertase